MNAIDYPVITVGKHENLVVRFSLAAQLLMRRRGVDPTKIGQALLSSKEDPNDEAVQNVLTVFSACVAENFVDLSNPNKLDLNSAPTADYWATQAEDFGEIEKAVWSAVGKAAEERRKKLAVVPPTIEQAS